MREWLEKHGVYWTFGLFVLAFLGTVGGLGVWALDAQDARQTARVERVSAEVGNVSTAAESELRRVVGKVEAEVKRLDSRDDSTLDLIRRLDARFDRVDERLDRVDERFDRMDAKLDRMNDKLDALLIRFAAPAAN